mgnify:CR=1 FL=1
MNKKESEFNKVFSAWDILVIAFGAMIGWGWVVSTGNWIEKGGVLGRPDLRRADSRNATVWWRTRIQSSCNGSDRFFYLYMGNRFRICQCSVF